MANIEYDTYRGSTPPPAGSRIRVVVIFLVVSAITAAAIYFLLPKSTEPEPAPNPPKSAEEAGNPPINEATEATSVNQGNDSTGSEAPVADDSARSVETEEVDTKNSTNTSAEASKDPIKGVPWSGDAPEPPPTPVDPEARAAAVKNWQSVLAGEAPWVVVHSVVRGESLGHLARRYHTTVTALREFNHLKRDTIMIGQKLRVVPGPWRIEVSKSTRQLKLINTANSENRVFGVYDVGIGRQNRTPSADFVISIRLRHPDYIAPDGSVHAYRTAENPLGDYFLKLAQPTSVNRPLAGYGIHGTGDDREVGRSLSHGCIRMKNDEVKQLYLLCPVATPVRIEE